ncbi:hypothetical protein P7C70_g2886, partial [Phenoliferia sp. Uapishka_3]
MPGSPFLNGMPSSPSPSLRIKKLFKFRKPNQSVSAPSSPIPITLTRNPSRITPISSSTPPSELPKSWEEWGELYAEGLVEWEDPPLPPAPLNEAPPGSFTELGFYRAPAHRNEQQRQRTVSSINLPQYKDLVGSHCYPAASNNPALLDVHGPLKKLTNYAHKRFGTNGVSCSVLDDGMLYYLAEVGFGLSTLKRETTLCSHTMLKAQTGNPSPFVCLNIEADWRFNQNDFAVYTRGFYAGASIGLPSPYESEAVQPVGIFCLIDEAPRTTFSDLDREDLAELAKQAGIEIQKWLNAREEKRKAELEERKDKWMNETGGLGVSKQAPDVAATKEAPTAEIGMRTTDRSPTLWRTKRRSGVGGSSSYKKASKFTGQVSDKARTVFDLSTQLVGETLSLDFTYIAKISLPRVLPPSPLPGSFETYSAPSSPASLAPVSPHLQIVSSHNLPLSSIYSVPLHLSLLNSSSPSLLFHSQDPKLDQPDEFVAGLLWRIDDQHVLGAFSNDPRRTFSKNDRAFVGRFAEDLKKWTGEELWTGDQW